MNLFREQATKEVQRLAHGICEEWHQARAMLREAHWSEWLAVFPVTLCVLGAIVVSNEVTFAVTMVVGIATLFLGQLWSERIRAQGHEQDGLKNLCHFFDNLGPRQTRVAYAGIFFLMALLSAAWHVGLHPVGNGAMPFSIIFF